MPNMDQDNLQSTTEDLQDDQFRLTTLGGGDPGNGTDSGTAGSGSENRDDDDLNEDDANLGGEGVGTGAGSDDQSDAGLPNYR